jgi:hypothetical protein
VDGEFGLIHGLDKGAFGFVVRHAAFVGLDVFDDDLDIFGRRGAFHRLTIGQDRHDRNESQRQSQQHRAERLHMNLPLVEIAFSASKAGTL